eukprot:CAMPEP_0194037498 /NCGR_PEP_ID=MMETSP0009_2-20130614/9848_1 /TAXON_ID=210454 /ORGANISM="Grammatophora oceanica, Strain CCMP 410" /LENGTH=309 /DNA_ID=CAMNT_0038679683 /DNA_START=146 /DNA_END=1075 /DNA_ORIENTATION=+
MEAPRMGNGQDFDPDAPYRMYHGETIPGFPQHPHRGFETITATIDGLVDHADSVGNAGRYGEGDVQWMTAGGGVVHSEMFPLLRTEQVNPLRFFQIWLNLPKRSKMVKPGFAMFWAGDVPNWSDTENKAKVTIWSGVDYFGVQSNNAPPPDSWASDVNNDVAIMHITLEPGGKVTVPGAHKGEEISRSLFYIEGETGHMQVEGEAIDDRVLLQVRADEEIQLALSDAAQTNGEFLLLQGRPIDEPVQQYGPFVMNEEWEIQQAFRDYQRTQFGGWPWPRDDMVFPRDKGRFAKLNGVETVPEEACKAKE